LKHRAPRSPERRVEPAHLVARTLGGATIVRCIRAFGRGSNGFRSGAVRRHGLLSAVPWCAGSPVRCRPHIVALLVSPDSSAPPTASTAAPIHAKHHDRGRSAATGSASMRQRGEVLRT